MPDVTGLLMIFESRRDGEGRRYSARLMLMAFIYVEGKLGADVENQFSTSALIC